MIIASANEMCEFLGGTFRYTPYSVLTSSADRREFHQMMLEAGSGSYSAVVFLVHNECSSLQCGQKELQELLAAQPGVPMIVLVLPGDPCLKVSSREEVVSLLQLLEGGDDVLKVVTLDKPMDEDVEGECTSYHQHVPH